MHAGVLYICCSHGGSGQWQQQQQQLLSLSIAIAANEAGRGEIPRSNT
jgi:hypothetical protein